MSTNNNSSYVSLVYHQMELLYDLKQDVDSIVYQLNLQNQLIVRMHRFHSYCKDFLDGTNQIGLKRLDLEYVKFERDYRQMSGKCRLLNQKLFSSSVYDKITDLFASLGDGCNKIGKEVDEQQRQDNEADDIDGDYDNNVNDSESFTTADHFSDTDLEADVVEKEKIMIPIMKSLENISADETEVEEEEDGSETKSENNELPFKCDFDGCGFKTKWAYNLKRHNSNVHHQFGDSQKNDSGSCSDDSVRSSSEQLRQYTPRQLTNLTKPQRSPEENLYLPPRKQQRKYRCDYELGCTFNTSKIDLLKRHQKTEHRRLQCSNVDCDYSTSQPTNLIRHQRIHSRFACDHRGCVYVGNRLSDLRVHQTKVHRQSLINNFPCKFENCRFVAKRKLDLKRHQVHHSPEPIDFYCNFENCQFTTTIRAWLIRHQLTHNTFRCSFPDCGYSGKRFVDLKVHRTKKHKNATTTSSTDESDD